MNNTTEWQYARDDLIIAVRSLGYPDELGNEIVKNLGSPKAMRRMTSYIYQAKPNSIEDVVDEMLAIKSEIDAWRQKKDSLEANARYNDMLMNGLTDEE